jgi:transposase
MEGLAAKRHPGPRPRLSEKQKEKLVALLLEGPQAHGYRNDLWTLSRLAQVIENHFGVRYHPAHVWKILHALGWSCQKPERRPKERDDKKIEQWRKETWPHIKNAREEGRSIVFIDESGFMLQPLVRRSWAPKGETPIQRQWERHDRLSAMAAITLAPRRNRLGLYWGMQCDNICAQDVVRFLRCIRRQLRRKLLVILDRGKVHRARVVQEYLGRLQGKIRLEPLPG